MCIYIYTYIYIYTHNMLVYTPYQNVAGLGRRPKGPIAL